MRNVLLIFAITFIVSACNQTLPAVASPPAAVVQPAPSSAPAGAVDQEVENRIAAIHLIYQRVKAICANDLAEAKAKKDTKAFAAALDKCADNFEKLANLVDKVRVEAANPRYEKDLLGIAYWMRKLVQLHREVRACFKPLVTAEQIDKCTEEAIERVKKE